ncbi:MAG: NADH-quinone oxidoreductase subunit L [Candidatus Omnitrophota bacterium]|jgi:NADH-quinone oxidoreductase subunit L
MTNSILLLPIYVPLFCGLVVLALRKSQRVKEGITFTATAINFLFAILLFKHDIVVSLPWAGFGMEFSLRLYHFSGFILLAVAFFSFLISLYSVSFMRSKEKLNQFYSYLLLSLALVNGAVLADNLILLLFFWEGLLLTLFGMIAIGNKGAFKTAVKALVIVGISDLCMMVGIGLTGHLAGTLKISEIYVPANTIGSVAFVLLMIGAIAKAGSMPFHSWIPDAATQAPLPFMAFLPASLEKLLGIYFLARISLDMFKLNAHSWLSTLLMVIGSITVVLAVMMALVQKDYKKLLSYHAISQVGYMILGIGTCLPIGIVGGLFHMINHAMYKSCLFLTAGSVEKAAGTTDLEKLGGLGRKMPVTFICFLVAAASISGVPPFNGFFSKEMVYDAALERGALFYVAAILGAFFTAASFLKLGHAVFLGQLKDAHKNVKESSPAMLVPMMLIAGGCILFGVYNVFPLRHFIQPILSVQLLNVPDFSGFPSNGMIVLITVLVLAGALFHHVTSAKIMGGGHKAAEHIRHAPVLSGIYDRAEARLLDPYDIGLRVVHAICRVGWWIDRAIDSVYDRFCVSISQRCSNVLRSLHNGNYALYIIWALIGSVAVVFYALQ